MAKAKAATMTTEKSTREQGIACMREGDDVCD
jgi:hypothetical protein